MDRKKTVLVIMADGCEEIEAVTVIDLLRRAQLQVSVASLKEGLVTGANGVRFAPDLVLGQVRRLEYDAVVLPGGGPGTRNLKGDTRVAELLKKTYEDGGMVAAICAAPTVLGAAGLLKEKKATCYPGCEGELNAGEYVTDDVVVDGQVITSRGPGTTFSFGLKLIELLCGAEKSVEIGRKTLAIKK